MYQEKLRKQRENPETSRAGLKWEVDEDNALINKIDEDHSINLEQAADKYKITTQDIQAYQANKKKRQLTNSLRNNPVNLNMIYALLVEINNKLN